MRTLFLVGLFSLPAFAAEIPENAYFMLVGPTDAQLAACPSPVAIKKGAFKNGEFLKSIFPKDKIEVGASKGDTYAFVAGARTVSIKVISASEFQWDEKGDPKANKLCHKAMYSTNAANQEQLDSMIPDEEIKEKADEAAPAKDSKAIKAGVKHPVKKDKK